jgi:hypothetical protein
MGPSSGTYVSIKFAALDFSISVRVKRVSPHAASTTAHITVYNTSKWNITKNNIGENQTAFLKIILTMMHLKFRRYSDDHIPV